MTRYLRLKKPTWMKALTPRFTHICITLIAVVLGYLTTEGYWVADWLLFFWGVVLSLAYVTVADNEYPDDDFMKDMHPDKLSVAAGHILTICCIALSSWLIAIYYAVMAVAAYHQRFLLTNTRQ